MRTYRNKRSISRCGPNFPKYLRSLIIYQKTEIRFVIRFVDCRLAVDWAGWERGASVCQVTTHEPAVIQLSAVNILSDGPGPLHCTVLYYSEVYSTVDCISLSYISLNLRPKFEREFRKKENVYCVRLQQLDFL